MRREKPRRDKEADFAYSRATVIVNPLAGGGRVLRSLPEIFEELKSRIPSVEFARTRGKEDATSVARKAVAKGSELVIVVGGDGTVNEAVNGMFEGSKSSGGDCVLATIPEGASCALAKELGIPRGSASLRVIVEGSVRPIDLIVLRWSTPAGERKERLALTVANFGFGGAVVRTMRGRTKRLGGFLAFGIGATLQLFLYRGVRMLVEADGKQIARSRVFCTIVANCQWEGGGMRVAPEATPDDGMLEIVVVEDLRVPSRLRHFPKVYTGKHLNLPAVKRAKARRVIIRAAGALPFEFDGESGECRECSIEIIPQVLRVLVPKEAVRREV